MGIDLGDYVVRHPTSIGDYAGRRLAFDAPNILYQFLSSIRGPDGKPLTDTRGNVTSHLIGILTRFGALVEAGLKPVFVFDGPPHPLKEKNTLEGRAARKVKASRQEAVAREELEAATAARQQAVTDGDRAAAERKESETRAKVRSQAAQTARLTTPMIAQSQALLSALGIPVVRGRRHEDAETLAASLQRHGHVDAVVTQDFDVLLFGAQVQVRNLSIGGARRVPGQVTPVEVTPEEVRLREVLDRTGLTREQLVDAAILMGTDYSPGVLGIGVRKAVGLVQDHGSIDALLRAIDANGPAGAAQKAVQAQRDALDDRDAVRGIFLGERDLDSDGMAAQLADLTVKAPDQEAVKAMLLGFDFRADRIEAGLARFVAARGKRTQRTLF